MKRMHRIFLELVKSVEFGNEQKVVIAFIGRFGIDRHLRREKRGNLSHKTVQHIRRDLEIFLFASSARGFEKFKHYYMLYHYSNFPFKVLSISALPPLTTAYQIYPPSAVNTAVLSGSVSIEG